jgi:uncharacterized metal-binding protein YceD (DUF177 family)
MSSTLKTRRESPFVVRLRDIPAEGTTFSLRLPAEWTRGVLGDSPLGWRTDDNGVTAQAQLFLTGREVVAHGTLRGQLAADCSRCTGPALLELTDPFEVLFVPAGDERLGPKPARPAPPEPEVVAPGSRPAKARFKPEPKPEPDEDLDDDSDCVGYTDEAIDLEDTLREQLLLALPFAPLCKESCAGLCARCGQDLNDGPCACAKTTEDQTDHRWAALKHVKL